MSGKSSVIVIVAVILVIGILVAVNYFNRTTASAEAYSPSKSDTDGKINLLLAGDVMCQAKQQVEGIRNGKFDFGYCFEYIEDLLRSADLTIGNLETNVSLSEPLGMDKERKYDKPYLNAPEEFLKTLKNVGFDVLVNANNHNCDTGVTGLKETIDLQEKYGLLHTGTFKSKKDKRTLIVEKEGIKIGIASYAVFYNNSRRDFSASQMDKHLNKYSYTKVKRDVKSMKKKGADFVLIYLHCGTEYAHTPNERQLKYSKQIAEAGADFIACSHAHTVQEYEFIKTKDGRKVPIMYSLGNFGSTQAGKKSKLVTLFSLDLEKKKGKVRVTNATYYPIMNIKHNPDTGRPYQLITCTEEGFGQIKDEKLLKEMKKARKTITKIVGEKISPVI